MPRINLLPWREGQRKERKLAFLVSLGIAALAAGFQRWLIRRATWLEAGMLVAAGLALTYPSQASDIGGVVLLTAVIAIQLLRKPAARSAA